MVQSTKAESGRSVEHAKLTMYSQNSLLGNEAIAEKLYGPDLEQRRHISVSLPQLALAEWAQTHP
jgi:alpha-D-ribose 1-methylphosphonate 5-triphosphate synthase subunit PhnH